MNRAAWILRTLLSYWLRHPVQLATFLVGLMSATALWSGVQAINLHARASYDRAAAALGGGGGAMILPAQDEDMPQAFFPALRQAGWQVSPLVEGRIRVRGRQIRLVGIEPVSMPRGAAIAPALNDDSLARFLSPAGQILIAPETAHALSAAEGEVLRTDADMPLPPLRVIGDIVPDILVTDIGWAQRLLNKPERVSRLLLDTAHSGERLPLESVAGDRLRVVAAGEETDLQRLTASFHSNLTAFGLLSFVVGLFIAHSAIGLVCEQRLPTLRTMRAIGTSWRGLVVVALAELIVLALLAGALGLVLGFFVAQLLLPDIAASLRGLYGAGVSSKLLVSPQWWAAGLAMSVGGALVAAAHALYRVFRLPVLASAHPHAWQVAQQRSLRWQGLLAGTAYVTAALLFWFGTGLAAGFALLGCILVGAALLLPLLLGFALQVIERAARAPLFQWLWADSRQQLSGLSLALMALLLALAVNIGVSTMVRNFNDAFLRWLDGRLLADVYLAGKDNRQTIEIEKWLKDRPEVSAILPSVRTETRIGGEAVELAGLPDHAIFQKAWPVLNASADAWDMLKSGKGVLVSEQLSRRLGLKLGSEIRIPAHASEWTVSVAGIYADYGNPKGQISADADQLLARLPDADRTRLGLLVDPAEIHSLMSQLEERFALTGRNLSDQASLKAEARRIFGRTFAVTAALNAFTLGVAGLALFTSLLSLGEARLPQLAPLWAMGVTRRKLAALEFVKTLMLALLTTAIAVPLGLVVAWCLIEIINVKAFGWRLPFSIYPDEIGRLLLIAALTACAAALFPLVKLLHARPVTLLRAFADER